MKITLSGRDECQFFFLLLDGVGGGSTQSTESFVMMGFRIFLKISGIHLSQIILLEQPYM